MTDPLQKYIKPGFPVMNDDSKSFKTQIDYIGPMAELEAGNPVKGRSWGDYAGYIKSTDFKPLEKTGYYELSIVCELEYDAKAEYPVKLFSTYETEWTSISRSLYEHKQFKLKGGGTYELIARDIADIEGWKNEPDAEIKKDYKYNPKSDYGITSGSGDTAIGLSPNAKMFARGIELGIENWDDYAPILRRTTTYLNAPPATSDAGSKEDPPSDFPNVPPDREWRKSADRSIRTGEKNRWERTEEWLGAVKVLIDKDSVYWDAPT